MVNNEQFDNMLWEVKRGADETVDNDFVQWCRELCISYLTAEIMRGGVVPRNIARERLDKEGFSLGINVRPYTYIPD